MGPGLLIKAMLQGSFSLMVFGWAQIVMDIQPLIVLITQQGQLHGFTHTFVGATLIGLFAAVTGKHLSEFGLKVLQIATKENPVYISWPVTVGSAFIGSFSHVVLDAVMYHDVEMYFPWSRDNPLLGMLSLEQMHLLCLASAAVGAVLYFSIQAFVFKRRISKLDQMR
jgi:membrane-bound metal-dependent hydrolase YbcI (DUF457 family)